MIRLYLRIAFKNILKAPFFSAINVVVISLAMFCVMLLSLWIRDELRFDQHLQYKDRLYRLTVEVNDPAVNLHSHFARTYQAWPSKLKGHFPEIEEISRISRIYDMVVKEGDQQFTGKFHQADSSFFRIFSVHLREGDPARALAEPHSIVLSAGFARTHFPAGNLIGKSILVYCRNCEGKTEFRITGIMEDLPRTSHFSMDMVASFPNADEVPDWAYYYLLLKKGSNADSLLKKLPAFISESEGPEEARISIPHLQKVTDIHLYSDKERELGENGNIRTVKLFAGIELFIWIIAMINFLNLRMTALLTSRKNFLAMKTFGAANASLHKQVLTEILILVLLALLFSAILLNALIIPFNAFVNKQILLFHNGNGLMLLSLALLLTILTLLTGFQPSFTFFNGRKSRSFFALKMQDTAISFAKNRRRLSLSGILIVLQFAAAIILISVAITVRKQASLLLSNRLGKNDEKILCLNNLPVQVVDRYQSFKTELLANPLIKEVTSTMEDPGDEALDKMNFESAGIASEVGKKMIYVYPADDNILKFYNIPLLAGENFPEYNGNDSLPESYILNETAVRMLGISPEEAIGRPFKLVPGWDNGKIFHEGKIVGVAKDFYTGSFRLPLMPMCYFQKKFWMYSCQIKVDPLQVNQALDHVRACWNKAYPEFPMNYRFIDDLYHDLYAQEIRQEKLLMLFSLLAIFISCLGLWSVSSLITRQRTKEIGIRKVNGATTLQIILLLNREFMMLVILAMAVGLPVSWYLLHAWLQNYTNRISPDAWIFASAVAMAMLTSVVTVSLQSWKTASRNPVKSLRYE